MEAETQIPMSREEKKVYELESIQDKAWENGGLIRTKEILDMGIDYRRILQFLEEGSLTRVKNGYYTTSLKDYSEEELICAMFPDGVLTMETALYYYGYLTQRPYGWSIAISKNTSKSRFHLEYPIVTPYYTEPQVLTLGTQVTQIGEYEMDIYTKDRLICDVLKYEEKMDRMLFREGVFSYIEDPEKDVAKLMEFAAARKVRKKVQAMIGVWL